MDLHERRGFKIAKRVSRWGTKELSSIRDFKDRDGDQIIQRYKKADEEQLLNQRMCHHLPGTDKILYNQNDQRIYSFPTDRGFGMFCELVYNHNIHCGILYHGIGKTDGVLFHRFFEPIGIEQVPDHIFTDPADRSTIISALDEESGWEQTSDYTFTYRNDGAIEIKYSHEKYSLRVLPIRKDLLN